MAAKLDFSGINSISGEAENRPGTEKSRGSSDARLEKIKEDNSKDLAVYQNYQENIKKSAALQTEILRGLKSGEDPITLLMAACKAIALMTDNQQFYSQAEGDIRTIYGEALLNPTPLQIELDAVRGRLKRLQEALVRSGYTYTQEEKRRLERAVEAHRAQEKLLLEKLETSGKQF